MEHCGCMGPPPWGPGPSPSAGWVTVVPVQWAQWKMVWLLAGATYPRQQDKNSRTAHMQSVTRWCSHPLSRIYLENPPPQIWKTCPLLVADKARHGILGKDKGSKKCVFTSVYVCLEGKTEKIMQKLTKVRTWQVGGNGLQFVDIQEMRLLCLSYGLTSHVKKVNWKGRESKP